VLSGVGMHAIALLLSIAVAAGQAPEPEGVPDAPGRQALRALALLSEGEPGVAEVQAAAARRAEAVPDPALAAARGRLAALLPRVAAEYRHDERSYRTAGLQGTGEVDYVRFEPGTVVTVRATWDLAGLVAPPRELAAATRRSAGPPRSTSRGGGSASRSSWIRPAPPVRSPRRSWRSSG
jgi:hypothetical protein